MEIIELTDKPSVIERLCAIEEQNFRGEAWNKQQLLDTLHNTLCHTYGCYVNQVMVGYCALLVADDADICNIVVDKPYRNNGYAKQMMEYMLSTAATLKAQRVFLDVNTNNEAAINLYRKYGFEILQIRRNYYPLANEHGSKHAYTMIKML